MLIHQDITQLPVFRKAVITIGTFDGVHTGHRQIINQLVEEAKAVKGESVIITFSPHPRMVLSAEEKEIKLLNTLDEKIELLSELDLDHLVIVPFTKEFSNQPAEEYISSFLVKNFHPHTIIIGYDHQFGKDRKGDYELLQSKGREYNYKVKEIPKQVLDEIAISSTKIREAIATNNISLANRFLGYPYFFGGQVIKGDQLGRTIGYPTANISVNDPQKLIPADGVYAVKVSVKKEFSLEPSIYTGMMNIGVRPTLGKRDRVIEINLFNFASDIYGATVKVTLLHFLRNEIKFNNLDELKTQLAVDKQHVVELLGNN